ncbi:uracil-DNA glycosylase [Sphaerotilus sp.]|uniref:uracil-DNA glycosylase n=1 Tax=Sphaerotilus sp. TaxID=2093942 RepID=UPI002ACD4443|nr:uracil-DNA glycosylase [Sphaerotilus sp.]MDZ7854694.1 uracil-DNA glycosylase [Sphaerotilus sp.]
MSVGYTERQQAMLQEMGIRVWVPPRVEVAEAAVPVVDVVVEGVGARVRGHDERGDVVARVVEVSAPVSGTVPEPVSELVPASVVALRSTGVAAMDWDALRAAVSSCRACTLCERRKQTVFGVGHPQAQWMLIGEAPGEQEDLQGEPFVGKAGQLLDNMLRAVGLTRSEAPAHEQVYIANVLKCRPPQNRNPEPQEVAQCEPYLLRQIALVQPKLILAMGRFAVQSLLKTAEPIGRLRGRVHEVQGVPVVVTYHPAYLLRNPLDKARSWEDLCLAREVMARAG